MSFSVVLFVAIKLSVNTKRERIYDCKWSVIFVIVVVIIYILGMHKKMNPRFPH